MKRTQEELQKLVEKYKSSLEEMEKRRKLIQDPNTVIWVCSPSPEYLMSFSIQPSIKD